MRLKTVFAAVLFLVAVVLVVWRLNDQVIEYFTALPADDTEARIEASIRDRGDNIVPLSLSSQWEMDDKLRFSALLSTQRADVLVVPPEASQAASLDATARILIAQRLAAAVADRTGRKVADPVMVIRALGLKRRSYDRNDIDRLAKAMGVTMVITGTVTRPTASDAGDIPLVFDVTFQAQAGVAAPTETTLKELRFDDALPPEEVFAGQLETVLSRLSIGTLQPPPARDTRLLLASLPDDPYALTTDHNASPLQQAFALQLLASFHPQADRVAALLWQRSLVALDRVDPTVKNARLMRARANFQLHRRPFAISLLAQPNDPSEKALRQIMDGNVVHAARETARIDEPGLRLLAELELEKLRVAYGQTHDHEQRRDSILARHTGYRPLLYFNLSQSDWFDHESAPMQAALLTQRGMEVYPWQFRLLAGTAFLGKLQIYLLPLLDLDFAVAGELEKVLNRQWLEQKTDWAATGFATGPNPGDYFELLARLNRAAALKNVSAVISHQDLAEKAGEQVDEIKKHFVMDADLAAIEAGILYRMGKAEGDGNQESRVRHQAYRLARDAYFWEGGETPYTPNLEGRMWRKRYIKYLDDPPSGERYWPLPNQNRFAATKPIAREAVERRLRFNLRRLQYTHSNFDVVTGLQADYRELGRDSEFAPLLQSVAHRFHGSESQSAFLAKIAKESNDAKLEEEIYQAALASAPNDWRHYERLGYFYLEHRRAQDAQKVFIHYPLFDKDDVPNRVETGNNAFSGAWALFKLGYPKLAEPLLKRAATYDTGSGSQMMAIATLHYLGGNNEEVATMLLKQLERYRQSHMAGLYIEWLFLLGQHEKAFVAFDRWSRVTDSGEPFWAAVVGHRFLGRSEADTLKFIEPWKLIQNNQDKGGIFRDAMALSAMFIDRQPSPDAMENIKRINASHGDRSFLHIATGYDAFTRRKYVDATRDWRVLHESMVNLSFRTQESYGYTLPYLALAHAAEGGIGKFKPEVERYGARLPDSFDYLLSKAVIAASEGRDDQAEMFLWRAFVHRPATGARPIPNAFMFLEITEAIYEQTRKDRYRIALVDYAQRLQKVWPFSFAYAFEAKYARNANDRIRALAWAQYLDRHSARIAHVSEADRALAQEWFKKHNLAARLPSPL